MKSSVSKPQQSLYNNVGHNMRKLVVTIILIGIISMGLFSFLKKEKKLKQIRIQLF